MDERELRSKRDEIRREIKKRMQQELDQQKKKIKTRIKKERISLQEKRQKYQLEVREQKLILMSQAKEEFRARKRMLGSPEQEVEPRPDHDVPEHSLHQPPVETPEPQFPEEEPLPYDEEIVPSDDAFIYDDKEDSDLRELQRPIGATDVMPAEMLGEGAGLPAGGARGIAFEQERAKSLFYYIFRLVIHPIQTLDEFDDYLQTPSGLVKVAAFYLVSLLPIVLFVLVGDDVISRLPAGRFWDAIGTRLLSDADILMIIGRTLAALLLYTAIIAVVNYFATEDANFVTLLIYFAFVEAETRVIIYTLLAATAFAAIMTSIVPHALLIVALLFVAFVIWRACLNIIVLMSAYGYDWYSAIFLAIAANYVQNIVVLIIARHFLYEPGL